MQYLPRMSAHLRCFVKFRSGKRRAHFCAKKFAEKYNLGKPVAGNWFEAQWDDSVPMIHAQLTD